MMKRGLRSPVSIHETQPRPGSLTSYLSSNLSQRQWAGIICVQWLRPWLAENTSYEHGYTYGKNEQVFHGVKPECKLLDQKFAEVVLPLKVVGRM